MNDPAIVGGVDTGAVVEASDPPAPGGELTIAAGGSQPYIGQMSAGNLWAQTFVATSSIAESVTFSADMVADPGTITLRAVLTETDISGNPTGTVLYTSDLFTVSYQSGESLADGGGPYQPFTIDLGDTPLEIGEQYALVFEGVSSTNSGRFLFAANQSNPYGDGKVVYSTDNDPTPTWLNTFNNFDLALTLDYADQQTATGTLTIFDPDTGEDHFNAAAGLAGLYGTLDIDVDGNWIYTLNSAHPTVDALAEGEEITDTVTVTTADGTTHDITITVTGTNDTPAIEGASTLTDDITEQAGLTGDATVLTATGTIAFSDVDTTDQHSVPTPTFVSAVWSDGAPLVSDPGGLAFGAVNQGADTVGWTYSIADSALDFLALNETLIVTYDVAVMDDSGAANDTSGADQIVVTMTGTNDKPLVEGSSTLTDGITEQADMTGSATVLTATGTIAFSDVDTTDQHSVPTPTFVSAVWSDGAPLLSDPGGLLIGAVDQGADTVGWTYSITDSAVDFLGAGETLTITYSFAVKDDSGAGERHFRRRSDRRHHHRHQRSPGRGRRHRLREWRHRDGDRA